MSLDGPAIYALESEIREHLVGGRVVGIGQPEELEIVVLLAYRGHSYHLRLSAHPLLSHICFYPGRGRTKPRSGFGSVLEKAIIGSILSDVRQPDFDRILRFTFRKRADLTPFEEYLLVVELLGRYSNLILLDSSGKILGALRGSSLKSSRRIMPGVAYKSPPPLRDLNPLQSSSAEIRKGLERDKGGSIGLALKQRIRGLTDGLVEEVLSRAGLEPADQSFPRQRMDCLLRELEGIFDDWRLGRFAPQVILDRDGRPDWLSITEIKGIPPQRKREFAWVSKAIGYLFDEGKKREVISNQKAYLLKVLNRKHRDWQLLLGKLEQEYLSSKNAEDYKIKADLINSHLKGLRKGMERAKLPNLYDAERGPIEVELDPRHTPEENAQLYYRHYKKTRKARVHIKRRIAELNEKLRVIVNMRDSLEELDDPLEVEKIRRKLQEMRLLPPSVGGRPEEKPRYRFLRFFTSDGWEVMLGRGDIQNDELTHRVAKPNDIWLHAQGVPGSHVIIRKGGRRDIPSQRALSEAASASAFFSRAKTSKVVPVVYTLKKWVRRPRGAKPGVVVFQREKTLFVEPKKPDIPNPL